MLTYFQIIKISCLQMQKKIFSAFLAVFVAMSLGLIVVTVTYVPVISLTLTNQTFFTSKLLELNFSTGYNLLYRFCFYDFFFKEEI